MSSSNVLSESNSPNRNSRPLELNMTSSAGAVVTNGSAKSPMTPMKDGQFFLNTLDLETKFLERRRDQAAAYLDDPSITPEAKGDIDVLLGKTQLLLTQKFAHFRKLCQQEEKTRNMDDASTDECLTDDDRKVLPQDLTGYWELTIIQVNELKSLYDKLDRDKANNWIVIKEEDETDKSLQNGHHTSHESSPNSDHKERKVKKSPLKTNGTTNGSSGKSDGGGGGGSARSNIREFIRKKRAAVSARKSKDGGDENHQPTTAANGAAASPKTPSTDGSADAESSTNGDATPTSQDANAAAAGGVLLMIS